MDLWKLKSMLEHRELHLARAVDQSDDCEGIVSDLTVAARPARAEAEARSITEALGQTITAEQLLGIYEFNNDLLRSETMLISWYLGEDESEEMWKAYCRPDDGVAIRSTAGKLIHCLPALVGDTAVVVGSVEYVDPGITYIPEWRAFDPFGFKRTQFGYERELRVMLIDREANPNGFKVPIDPESLIESIYIAQNRSGEHAQVVEAVLKRWCPTIPMHRSKFEPTG
jgi:hypothetical protein